MTSRIPRLWGIVAIRLGFGRDSSGSLGLTLYDDQAFVNARMR